VDTIFDCKLLIVDDEPELLKMLDGILRQEGFQRLITAASCLEARQRFESERPDGVILDISLPDGDGFSLMQEFRQRSAVPVLFLSARDEDENRLLGLGLGADDYITKPFLPRELILRLKAVLTRTYFPAIQREAVKPVFKLGETEIDLNRGTVQTKTGQLTLTAKEYALLEKLYANHGNIVTGDSLCRAAWGDDLYGYENTLMVHIRRLRQKIEPEPSAPQYLLTVRGLGYKLTGADGS
jgi:DNA-binding response OmpR family regulator